MDLFENPVDSKKFRSTNSLWNELKLNAPWSVGRTMQLVKHKHFSSKEEWETYYYESGEKRNQLILKLPDEIQTTLNDFSLDDKGVKLSSEYKKNNYDFGRTKEQLSSKAEVLFGEIEKQGNRLKISLEECIECVRFRTLCETWHGIIRERNTILKLQKRFPKIDFREVSSEDDYTYGIDCELYLNDKLLGAIQIKPPSYNGATDYLEKARKANEHKYNKYKKKHKNVGLAIIATDMEGNIEEDEGFIEKLTTYYKENA